MAEQRLIDANKLKQYVDSISGSWLSEWDTLGVLSAIDKQQTADAVEVVRCEDCEHCYVNREGVVAFNECELNHAHVQANDWFCADGVRKSDEYNLYSEFDADKHAEKYVHYLEALITADGKVMYAVPSHQELAIKLACEKYGISRDELSKRCPPEYYLDFTVWLLMQTGSIAVWTTFYIGNANKKQVETLKMLTAKGIYKGAVNERMIFDDELS